MASTGADARLDFIAGLTVAHFSLSGPNDPALNYMLEGGALERFFDDADVLFLIVLHNRAKDQILAMTEVPQDEERLNAMIFYKTSPQPINMENLHTIVQVVTMSNSPLSALYQSLHNVFSPLLLKSSSAWSGKLDRRLQTLMSELDDSLEKRLRMQGSAGETISSFADEYAYWGDVSASASNLSGRERAQYFQDVLRDTKDDMQTLASTSIYDLQEVAERTQDVLDDLWRQTQHDPPFPEDRMRRLIDIAGVHLASALEKRLAQVDLWQDEYHKVRDVLQAGMAVCTRWQNAVDELTGQFWRSYQPHLWTSGKMTTKELSALGTRLEHILSIRTTHDQMLSLLSKDEQLTYDTDRMFDVFSPINALHVSDFTQHTWDAAVASYHKSLEPVEAVVATKLRAQFKELQSSSQSLQMHFTKYRELVSRPAVAHGLQSEREILLSQLKQELERVRAAFQTAITNEDGGKAMGRAVPSVNTPLVVRSILFCRQLWGRLKSVVSACDPLLVDVEGSSDLVDAALELMQEIKAHEKELFQDWVRDTQAELSNEDIMMESTGRIMQFDSRDGHLTVHYSDRLMALLREVRQLRALGLVVPADILKSVTTAKAFYKHAVILKQVAHFYNSIGQQILEPQYLMLERHARNLEAVIKRPVKSHGSSSGGSGSGSVEWQNTEELDAFITELQTAAGLLTRENRKLRRYHELFKEKTLELMGLDLLKQQSKWKEGFGYFRTVCAQLTAQGFSSDAMRPWQLHWDYQLYKALDVKYRFGLERLHERLPELKVDLVFRQQALQFRPPLEEVRAKYYRELKRFLVIPSKIGGVGGGGGDVYKHILHRNAQGFAAVYKKAEQLFHRLAKVVHEFKDWVVIGCVDIEALAAEHLENVEDWEANFRMLKTKGREAEKLPNQVKVDCITVATTPVKSAIDDHIQRLFDALVNSLRKSIMSHVNKIDDFVEQGMAALSMRPQSLAEIGEANQKHADLSAQRPYLKPAFDTAHAKNKLLRSVAGSGIDMQALQQRWDKFELMLESHALMIKEQVDVMRSSVNTRAEDFNNTVDKFCAKWEALRPKDADIGDRDAALKAVQTIKEKRKELEELEERATEIRQESDHFGVEVAGLAVLEEVKANIEALESTWVVFEQFTSELDTFAEEEWITFRGKTHRFADFLDKWTAQVKQSRASSVSVRISQDLELYRNVLPLLKYVRGDAFSTDHWVELFGILQLPTSTPVESLLFRDILGAAQHMANNVPALKDLHSRAQGEVTIREALHEVDLWGASATFTLSSFEDCNGQEIPLIKEWKELLSKLGDNQSLLSSLKDSPYYPAFADKAGLWEQKLAELTEVLDRLKTIQRKWIYLEPIFGRGALPKEQGRFRSVDSDFKQIMLDVKRDDRVMRVVGIKGFPAKLETMSDQLTRCQKSLNEFLEQKRSAFPRFYFIGDDDMLEILGQATDPTVIQTHLKKLFAGIHKVGFSEKKDQVVTMISQDGEVVKLQTPVSISVNVESWLSALADAMKEALGMSLSRCVADEQPDPMLYSSQVLCVAEQINFTQLAEDAIVSNTLPAARRALASKLESYTSADVDTSTVEGRVLQLKLKALILDVIHMIEIVDLLVQNRVTTLDNWYWQKNLRYSLEDGRMEELGQTDRHATVRMCDALFDYTYEYQGNAPKLVHTPLTDKCYLTLTQGMHMGFGGNPYGPAGTGKTESVKALGNAMGRQVLVFNCDEGIDVKSMGRIFIGLVKCGAWGCFDEFNRLEEAVLSAVSMQIQVIQAALKSGQPQAELLGRTVDINPNSGIFITLNPAGKGYGGRQKLPDNLKQLFRPVAMSRPDLELIAEVMLFAEGFRAAKDLGRKLVAIYSMAKELLSPQQHYDWGLRALKTILRGAGHLLAKRRKNAQANGDDGDGSGGDAVDSRVEAFLLVQALRVNTLSKLSFADAKRFDGLISNVFTDVSLAEIEYHELSQAIAEAYEELGLVPTETQTKKMLELHEQLRQRMGVVIVGPSGSGKTMVWRVLHHAMSKLAANRIKTYVMNPKAMPRQQLLGHIDPDTRDWYDGVLTAAARQVVKEPLDQHSWIVCDGDIDPEWIESLNSVLDDNRLLTMPSGERIQFGPNVNFVFETHDLSCASPATISRMGMIFLSDEDTDVRSLVQAWLQQRTPADTAAPGADSQEGEDGLNDNDQENRRDSSNKKQDKSGNSNSSKRSAAAARANKSHVRVVPFADASHRLLVSDFLDDHFYRALAKAQELAATESHAEQGRVGIVFNALSQLSGADSVVELAVRLVRGLGGPLSLPARSQLAKEMFGWIREPLPDPRRPLDAYVDESGSVANYTSQADVELTVEDVVSSPLIMTTDVQRTLDTLRPWMEQRLDFILVGPEGVGKSNLLFQLFAQQQRASVAIMHCNAQTTPQDVVQTLSQACMVLTTNVGRVFRPKEGESLILYIKDINLPKPDKWGTSFIVQFLQQLIAYRGFYDANLDWVGIENVQIVASMNPSSTMGRHPLSTRFTSTVKILYMDYSEGAQMQEVYTSMLGPVLHFKYQGMGQWTTPQNVSRLAASMVAVYEFAKREFTRDTQGHYIFTPVFLTEWALSLLRYDLSAVNLLDAWAYSAQLLFRNTLIADHQARFDSFLSALLQRDWGHDLEKLNNSVFTTFIPAEVQTAGQGKPLSLVSLDDYADMLKTGITRHNREHAPLTLKLFPEMMRRIAAVEMAVSAPGGSLLMAGRAGCGRRSALKLVTFMMTMETVSPNVGRNYSLKSFKADLKQAMQRAGVEGVDTVLLIEDYQLLEASYSELLNSLISTGDIPGLFQPAELEPMLASLKDAAAEEGWRSGMFRFFTQRVKDHLHVTLSLDCSREDFAFLCESNPAFIKECRMLWAERWSPASMGVLPQLLLEDQVPEAVLEDPDVTETLATIHADAVARLDASPHDFTQFIVTFARLFQNKTQESGKEGQRFRRGLDKLHEAGARVDELKAQASEQQEVLAAKQAEANQALQDIQAAMEQASEQKTQVEQLKRQLAEEEAKLSQRKKAIEVELSSIEPILAAAQKAVGSIKSEALTEIRSLRAPPDAVRDILQGVLMLMGIYDTSWKSMKSFLAKRGVKDEIINFDQRKITPSIREQVEALIEDRHASFEAANAKRASRAAAPLSSWVQANLKYAAVLEKVGPLEEENKELEASLAKAEAKLKALTDDLSKIDAHVAELRERFERNTTEGAKLKVEVDQAQATINSAEMLISKLDGEKQRWSRQVSAIEDEARLLPLEAMLSAAFVTYLPCAAEQVRLDLTNKWVEACGLVHEKPTYSALAFLATESKQLVWRSEGLPSDQLSLENAAVVANTAKPLFIVDPASTALSWLQEHLKDARLEVTAQKDANFATALELAVRFGKTLLVQGVSLVEPIMYPTIRQELIVQGPRTCVYVGDKLIDYNEDFRLILTTQRASADLPPDVRSHLCEINFTVTQAGLAGQLLARTLRHEKPELEARKTELLKNEESLKLKLNELEDKLLKELADAEGNILENKALLDSLNETKASSTVISTSLQESQQLQESLNKERDAFLPLAQHASTLFFLMKGLSNINHMYQFSLASFVGLFERTLAEKTGEAAGSPDMRIKMLCSKLQQLVYGYVSRSLFKRDRLTFAMHLTRGIFPEEFDEDAWHALTAPIGTAGGGAGGGNAANASPSRRASTMDRTSGGGGGGIPSWTPPDRVAAVRSVLEAVPSLGRSARLEEDAAVWRNWMEQPACERNFPSHVVRKVQQLLLVKALRPDRLQAAMTGLACRFLGLDDLTPPATNLHALHEAETTPTEPVLMVVSAGADPSQELREAATHVLGSADRLHEVAMGQGQAEVAVTKLRQCAARGEWLCLKNLHLVTHWLPELEQELSTLNPDPSFRLWLTTEPHDRFSPILLQKSLKVTFESPPGVKRNLLRTYSTIEPATLKGGSSLFAQALFLLAWFHAIVQERRNYIPHGWCKFYEFSSSDLRASIEVLKRWSSGTLSSSSSVSPANQGGPRATLSTSPAAGGDRDWVTLHGLFLNALYGGRVDNVFDAQVLETYLHDYFADEVLSGQQHTLSTSGSGLHGGGGGGKRGRLGGINIPTSVHLPDYVQAIRNLPDTDQPELFGLPANVDKTVQQQAATELLTQLQQLERAGKLSEDFDRERWRDALQPFLAAWERLVDGRDLLKGGDGDGVAGAGGPGKGKGKGRGGGSAVGGAGDEDALTAFVRLERAQGRRVIAMVQGDLQELRAVLQAQSLLTQRVNQIARALLRGETPAVWLKLWDGPEVAAVWVRQVVRKTLALRGYEEKAKTGALLHETLDIGNFFRPGTLFNALRQQTAAAFACSMDSLRLVCEWNADKIANTHVSCRVQGLLIQGCMFDGTRLHVAERDSPTFAPLPHVCVGWVPADLLDEQDVASRTLTVPLYADNERQMLVTRLTLPCTSQKRKWVQAGVALFIAQ
ncbi:dynein heavy chain isotype 1B [Salpingoeca rosetta]|uniref:Cytoplasmic dynein 2 heavy chain 1 n=1 Tax=Salpingoeca rosetta (strain ATCC 50818 / BSB-021) TaxID=946362 RepID=F2UHZ4_SALR5|nr:dynein heavy chain isotype 1B [Salpingoeca rosetta]EGD76743.1 dynein heavy chain isotype 1B [Salpingoeca rosetta]|eukprot:XP_004991115.1 dynein heavy chain isotype 1B [Salpingoeca rosetta]